MSAALGLALCPALACAAAAPCLPAGIPVSSRGLSAVPPPLKSVQVYLDGSYSMIGYVRAASASVRPHGDLLAVIDSFSSRRSAPVSYARFGARIAPIPAAGASAYARTEPYDC